jgi:hypothetical protein
MYSISSIGSDFEHKKLLIAELIGSRRFVFSTLDTLRDAQRISRLSGHSGSPQPLQALVHPWRGGVVAHHGAHYRGAPAQGHLIAAQAGSTF